MTETTKYTKGPWELWTSNSWRRFGSADGLSVCEPVTHPKDRHPDLYFRNGGESGPDARLIAAAPEMAEALLAFLRADLSDTKQGLALDERVRAALQKAGLL